MSAFANPLGRPQSILISQVAVLPFAGNLKYIQISLRGCLVMAAHINISHLLGYSRLAVTITAEVTDAAEAMHYAVAHPLGSFGASPPGRTGGISGLVYRGIRVSSLLLGASIDTALAQLMPLFDEPSSTPQRQAVLAAVNGIWGDSLEAGDNPLAIRMSLRQGGQSLVLEKQALEAALSETSGRLLVLAHGLCGSDLQWSYGGHGDGAALARDLGYTPLYLHYNSGLHISVNGRRFAGLLEALVREWPQPVEELVIIGHSMGGLVSRSACHYGAEAGHAWPQHLRKLIFLGTPHHGSPLERVGNWAGQVLGATPYTAPLGRLSMRRSHGITDLRYGNLLDEDWLGLDRFANGPDSRRPVPLPDGVQCYAIAATTGTGPGDLRGRLIGDGMVPLASALGRHQQVDRCLAFPEAQQWIGYSMNHTDLLSHPAVYAKISQWLAS